MRCPYCHELDDKVVDSRLTDEGVAIRRRRECLACGRRYTTYERFDEVPLIVVKRAGQKESFDRAKLVAGISQAAVNRPVDAATIEAMAAEVEEGLRAIGAEVGTDQVGFAVLERLRVLDPVSYLRFASVYKGFEGVADFEREFAELQKTTAPKRRA